MTKLFDRRQFLWQTGAAALCSLVPLGSVGAASNSRWLKSTRFINSDHPSIVRLANRLSQNSRSDRDKAVKIFQYVRDSVRFGFTRSFYNMKASDVLRAKRGYCNTKSTLFIALLRAAGIPARQVFVSIDTGILSGLIDPGTPALDHSYTEVYLGGRWLQTDAYIVDRRLAAKARARLRREGRRFGYGFHVNGTTSWNGRSSSFSQYVGSARRSPRFGRFEDVGDFYRRSGRTWNRLGGVARLIAGSALSRANRNIAAIRSG